jgi:hypothetical protein
MSALRPAALAGCLALAIASSGCATIACGAIGSQWPTYESKAVSDPRSVGVEEHVVVQLANSPNRPEVAPLEVAPLEGSFGAIVDRGGQVVVTPRDATDPGAAMAIWTSRGLGLAPLDRIHRIVVRRRDGSHIALGIFVGVLLDSAALVAVANVCTGGRCALPGGMR